MVGQDDGEFDEIVCPITLRIMQDPVIAADDHTYERSAIQEWIERATKGAPDSGSSCWAVLLTDWSRLVSQRGRCRCHPRRACPWGRSSSPIMPSDSYWR
jgi:hypothetical protein